MDPPAGRRRRSAQIAHPVAGQRRDHAGVGEDAPGFSSRRARAASCGTRSILLVGGATPRGLEAESRMAWCRVDGAIGIDQQPRRVGVDGALPCGCTMARSSRRRERKIPGVSTKTSWRSRLGAMAMPRMRLRVVCTLGVTMATLAPTSGLTRVDLPALGTPRMATKPRCAFAAHAFHRSLSRQHRMPPPARPPASPPRRPRVAAVALSTSTVNSRLVRGPRGRHSGKSAAAAPRLRPFLQRRLGRPRRDIRPIRRSPQTLDDGGRRPRPSSR